MGRSSSDQPKYLACARALALLGGAAVGSVGCGSQTSPYKGDAVGISIVDSGGQGGAGGEGGTGGGGGAGGGGYDGGITGTVVIPTDAGGEGGSGGHDGGPLGVIINPDASS